MSTDAETIRQKLDALRELKREKEMRHQEARDRAYENTIATHGRIPQLILDGPYSTHDEQRKKFLAENGHPEFYFEHHFVDPPPHIEDIVPNHPLPSYITDAAQPVTATPAQEPPPPGPAASLCMTMERRFPIFYIYDPDTRTLTLAEHSGEPSRVGGKLFQDTLPRNANADEMAVTLWERARGKSGDDFDGPIVDYSLAPRLPRGA